MNICYASDHNYAPVLAVSIISLLKHNTSRQINIYVLDSGLTEQDKTRLVDIVSKYSHGGHIEFHDVLALIDRIRDMGLPPFFGKYSPYARLAMSETLPENIGKILYLDADTLIKDDISAFYDTDITGKILAGIQDIVEERFYLVNGMPADYKYVNSGVLLINLPEWNKYFTLQGIRDIAGGLKTINYPDQDMINSLLYKTDGGIVVGLRYNTLAIYFDWDKKYLTRRYPKTTRMIYSMDEIQEAVKSPAIVHLVEGMVGRPWLEGSVSPFTEEWTAILKETEFYAEFKKFKNKWRFLRKLNVWVYKMFPQCVSSFVMDMREKLGR